MIYAVLVCYYEKYKKNSIVEFHKLLASFGHPFTIIIVNNNHNLQKCSDNYNLIEIAGSNAGWEFSAWDEGVQYIKENYDPLSAQDFFIFANDTFNHHRLFCFLDLFFFKQSVLKHVASSKPTIIGEVNSFNQEFSVDGYSGTKWVSTYLFAVNFNYMNKLLKFDMGDDTFQTLCTDVTLKNIVFSNKVSVNLASHLTDWMYPKTKKFSWYGNKKNDVTLFRNKLKAILNEKRLSINCLRYGGEIISSYHTIPSSLYLKIKNFIYYRFLSNY